MSNAKPCYSNLQNYGLEPYYRPIKAPVPSTVMLALFETNKPHDIPQPKLENDRSAYKCHKNINMCN